MLYIVLKIYLSIMAFFLSNVKTLFVYRNVARCKPCQEPARLNSIAALAIERFRLLLVLPLPGFLRLSGPHSFCEASWIASLEQRIVQQDLTLRKEHQRDLQAEMDFVESAAVLSLMFSESLRVKGCRDVLNMRWPEATMLP